MVSLVATDVGSGVDVTYFVLDGGDLNMGTQVLAATEGTHTLQYWSTDASANVEPTNTAVFYVDRTAPVTTSDAVASYTASATIQLSAVDESGGSGVASTWFRLDGAAETTGSVVTTDTVGDHVLEFWSVDNAGNVEATKTATFTISSAIVLTEPFNVTPITFGVGPTGADQAFAGIVGRQPPDGFALAPSGSTLTSSG